MKDILQFKIRKFNEKIDEAVRKKKFNLAVLLVIERMRAMDEYIKHS